MKKKTCLSCLTVVMALALGTLSAAAAEKGSRAAPVELTETGQKLEARYAEQMKTLKEKLSEVLPVLDAQKKTAYLDARDAEEAAEARVEKAQQRMGEVTKAKALVGHAKGKWIGGADKGIAAAKAKLKKATTDAERSAAQAELVKWQKNREDGVEALQERQAALDKAERDLPGIEKELKEAKEAFAQAKAHTMAVVKDLGVLSLLSSDKLDAALAHYLVLSEATPRGLAAFAQQGREQHQLIERMLADRDLLVQMAVADGAKDGKYGRAMEIYQAIQQASSKAREGALQRLALAVSLEHATPISQRNAAGATDAPATVDPVKRYLHYEQAFLAGELDPAFKNLSVWDYRMVVDGNEPDAILSWGREMLRNYRPDQVTKSDYRWRYVELVRSDIRYGSQDNKYDENDLQFFQNILKNGGVCGRRAFIGRFVLRAFGIPTTARPQRGHAALVHWTPDGWVPCLGAGWGSGWTKTRYKSDVDFLATTQARAAGEPFMMVKRAQWIGDAMGEPQVFGFNAAGDPAFWYGVSLYTQRGVIEAAEAKTLDAVGQDIAEANETKETIEITDVTLTEAERNIHVDRNGTITVPAAATSKPTRSTGKIIFMDSVLGGKQLHYSRNGGAQEFDYTFEAPASGKYALTARVVTPSWKQNLLLTVNGAAKPVTLPLPHTVGLWDTTEPVVVALDQGRNVLTFSHQTEPDAYAKGFSIKDFTLKPL